MLPYPNDAPNEIWFRSILEIFMFESVNGVTDAQTGTARVPSLKLRLWTFGSGQLITLVDEHFLTHCLLMSSTYNIYKQCSPRSGPKIFWSVSKLFNTDGFPDRNFRKSWF